MAFPTAGPFEVSANVNKDEASFSVTDIAGQINGPPDTPAIKISAGEASGGQDDPLHIALQGQFGETPFAFTLVSAQPLEGLSQTTPWPVEARLNLADIKLNIEGNLIPATATERFEFDTQLQGETFNRPDPISFRFTLKLQREAMRLANLKAPSTMPGPGRRFAL